MSQLVKALNSTTTTENGCKTNYSSLDANLDLFFAVGSSRGTNLTELISKAFVENKDLAIRNILHARDIRGGLGERQTSLDLAKYVLPSLSTKHTTSLLKAFVEVGRWKDIKELLTVIKTKKATVNNFITFWAETALAGDGLAAKWLPVKDSKGAKPFRKAVNMNEHQWRKAIVSVRNTVEQKVCANEWGNIEYSKIPSLAMKKYYTAFFRHDEQRFNAYINSLTKGETKINASILFPHDIISQFSYRVGLYSGIKDSTTKATKDLLDAQWKALPNYLEGSKENILSVIDTSGSMETTVAGKIKALDIALGLGIYCAERSEGIFNNTFISFSKTPELHNIKGTLSQKMDQICRSKWDMNTDLEAVFELILDTAVTNNIPESEMPSKLLIVSDMEFDRCIQDTSALDMMKQRYDQAGYEMPQVVFWAVKSRIGNVPVTTDDKGTALISGFNPAIIPSILGDEISPKAVMEKALMKDRYSLDSYMN